MKNIVLVPLKYLPDSLSYPAPCDRQPNSLDKKVFHMNFSGPVINLSTESLMLVSRW